MFLFTTSGFEPPYWLTGEWYHLVALPYLGKVTKALPSTPSGYEMAAERMFWG